MNILITGIAGLIGSNLSNWIMDNTDHTVIGIDNLSGGYFENINMIPNRLFFYNNDLSNEFKSIEEIFIYHSIDIVYHLAAYAAEGLSPFIRTFNYKNNLISTANIINLCIKYDVKRLVYTSSMAVYGKNIPPFQEHFTPKPIDPYGVAKYACEMDIKIAAEQHGLDYCIIRPHNVYSEKQNIWDKYRNVLGIWMYKHLHNKPIVIFGSGEQERAFSYTGDIVEPLWNAAILPEASKQIINLGGTKPISILNAAKTLVKVMNGGKIIHAENRHEVKEAYSTWQKSVDILRYKENHTLEQGLSKMWQWAKVQPDRPQFIWPEYEIDKGIYSYWRK